MVYSTHFTNIYYIYMFDVLCKGINAYVSDIYVNVLPHESAQLILICGTF